MDSDDEHQAGHQPTDLDQYDRFTPDYDYDEEDAEESDERQYNARLLQASMHNGGQGIRVKVFVQPTFPPLAAGKRRRANCAKPKQQPAEIFFAHEELRLHKFFWSKRGSGDLPLMSFKAWEDCIQQINAKADTDLKIMAEEIEQPEVPADPGQTQSSSTPTAETQDAADTPERGRDESARSSKRSKKTHEKSEEELIIEDFVSKLMTEHACEDRKCPSPHCFVAPDSTHVVLTPAALDYWASAMAAGKEDVTITNPPVHHFYVKDETHVDDIKTLAARRRNLINHTQGGITINFGSDEAKSLREPLQSRTNSQSPTLPPKQTLSQWKEAHGLDQAIITILESAKITGPHALEYVTDQELKDLGLVIGQRADVRDAEKRWKLGL
ncbi:hypothetical protein K435DRAFT_860991 [Dendrothele bispora CBS 962.96]|uniref:Uncharacterized protein n=1 Tax=Dendrothele bispora (strain CBS 962.96) TaxID=1314807 RepID=A0A4S8LWG6_DENBC|nr:hypothetical protein K435DRAFT_860991 [Dendrothele bispora CBS 962.96]